MRSGRSSASSAGRGCWPPKWSALAGLPGWTTTTWSIPIGCGGCRDEPRPLAVQIWDNNPDTLARVGARLAHEYRVSVVDINFGCPVREVTEKAHSGSYLLRFPERIGAIVERVVQACAPTPVTAKIRLGCTRERNPRDRGGAGGRSRRGRRPDRPRPRGPGLFQRPRGLGSDRSHQAAPEADAADRQRRSGFGRESGSRAAALPSGRRDDRPRGAGPAVAVPASPGGASRRSRFRPIRRWTSSGRSCCGITGWCSSGSASQKGTMLMRKYACCYAQGRPGARHFRTHIAHASTPEEFYAVVEQHFPRER